MADLPKINRQQGIIAVRLLTVERTRRNNENVSLRNRFGDRITTSLTHECAQRDDEIEALDAVIALIEAAAE